MKTLVDIFDVLLVSFLIYRLILLIKGTRAMQVAWGFILLFLLTGLVQMLNLKATGWLLEQFWLAGIVLLVVVFQPEIRGALANLGSHPLGRILEINEFEFIDDILEAMKELSRLRHGALIILEQDTGLRNFTETGTTINGEVSPELIQSIFDPHSPLHDGALIVSNSRIVAAGCLLPLTQEQELSKILGTRHRAAVGLSEISDAIALVVSEETGTFSIARNGKLQRNADPEELKEQLLSLYRSKVEKSLLRRVQART